MRKLLLAVLVAVAASILSGCFSLGVSDEDAYLAKFGEVSVLDETYGEKKFNLSKFVRGDEFEETFSAANYRFVAIRTKESVTADEMGFYVYLPAGEAACGLTVQYYVADKLPAEVKDQEDESVPYDPGLSDGTTEFYRKTVRLAPGRWNDLYAQFPATEIPEGSYLMLGFQENVDAAFSADEGRYAAKKQNDVKLTVDKLLIHIRS